MATIVRTADRPYGWELGEAPLAKVANVERKMPESYITANGFGITDAARRYLEPLIAGEDYPPFQGRAARLRGPQERTGRQEAGTVRRVTERFTQVGFRRRPQGPRDESSSCIAA